MIRVGITGIEGLIGWHLRVFLHGISDIQVIEANRATFANPELLREFADSCDIIVHLAGMNRGSDEEVVTTNVSLTEDLIAACEHKTCSPHIIFSSSTHIYKETPYGGSKKACAERLQNWARRNNALFTNLIMPHIFGEGGKPFYNSVTSTFAHQIANEEAPNIIVDGALELLHAQEVAREIYNVIKRGTIGDLRLAGIPIMVSELLDKLKYYAELYRNHTIPLLSDPFERNLFNTFRYYLFPMRYPVKTILHEDARGFLFETIKSLGGGQSFISVTKPGIARGNHYHCHKIERFFVLKGQAEIRIRKMFSNDIVSFYVDGNIPSYVDIPTLHTHNITNVGDGDLLTFFWANEIFDPQNSDTFAETV